MQNWVHQLQTARGFRAGGHFRVWVSEPQIVKLDMGAKIQAYRVYVNGFRVLASGFEKDKVLVQGCKAAGS